MNDIYDLFPEIPWGPSGRVVYERTYSRTLPSGNKEAWPQTVSRVVRGNLELVHGSCEHWPKEVHQEADRLAELMLDFKILPAGRHLWASGVKGRQYLFNCWTSGWDAKLSDHFNFTFLRLMEGGGVGANYSSHFLAPYGAPRRELDVHIVCDPGHPDYDELLEAGVLSLDYDSEWTGAFEVEDSREGWASALVDLIDTYMSDGDVLHRGRVYDVSRVRGRGSRLKTFGGTASGPTPFASMMHRVSGVMNATWAEGDPLYAAPKRHLTPMDAMEIDHAIAECVVSGGNRRSARMSIVRWDDPFIFDFIECKSDPSQHWTTNISVEVDDEFLALVAKGYSGQMFGEFGTYSRGAQALRVHQAVINGMLVNGEPGYWNSSLSNKGEIEPVYATNPCGEITLRPWEACNLGHVNLSAFAPTQASDYPDEAGLIEAHILMTRFLMRATYADINDPKSREIQDRNRRIGVGHFGVQGFLAKSGYKFSDVAIDTRSPGYWAFRGLLDRLYKAVRNEARSYAFQLRIPEPVKVTTVAPTGSIAKLPGATEGIHPIYARYFERRIRFNPASDANQRRMVEEAAAQGLSVETDIYDQSGKTEVVVYPTKDPLVAEVEAMGLPGSLVESADEIPLGTMLAFQAMYQQHFADNAVSFTVNVPAGINRQLAEGVISMWLPKLKGTTIMVDESRPQSPYTRITQAEYEASQVQSVEDSIDLECQQGGACPIR